MPPTVFVCGATGTQGGALARHLIPAGATVHALARDPSSPKAKALEALGVALWHGDFDNEAALRSAIAGTDAVFLNFMPDFDDFGANLRQAKLIMSIAKEAGATNVVFSGGLGVDNLAALLGEDHPKGPLAALLASKFHIEEAVKAAGFDTYAILRPANFMANYIDPFVRIQFAGLAETGRSVRATDPTAVLPLVSTKTIGAFSAAAILDPQRFNGHIVSYADELVTLNQVFEKLRAVTGKDLQYSRMSDDEIEAQKSTNPFVGGGLALANLVNFVDLDEVRKWDIPLETLDEFFEREKEVVLGTYANAPSI